MPKKRRSNGRNKKNRGHVKSVRCSNCGRCVPKDKAIKRSVVRNMIDDASLRDVYEAVAYNDWYVPRIWFKISYCVSCAINSHVVRKRSREERKNRLPPPRVRYRDGRRINPAVTAAQRVW